MLMKIQDAIKKKNIIWREHALARLLERNLSRNDVINAIKSGSLIETYPDVKPYPGCLISGVSGNKTIHVVAAWDETACSVYIITNIPDNDHFLNNGATRKAR